MSKGVILTRVLNKKGKVKYCVIFNGNAVFVSGSRKLSRYVAMYLNTGNCEGVLCKRLTKRLDLIRNTVHEEGTAVKYAPKVEVKLGSDRVGLFAELLKYEDGTKDSADIRVHAYEHTKDLICHLPLSFILAVIHAYLLKNDFDIHQAVDYLPYSQEVRDSIRDRVIELNPVETQETEVTMEVSSND